VYSTNNKPCARLARLKFTRPCSTCCCLSHCEISPHDGKNDVVVQLDDLELPDAKDVEASDMLDRSWMDTA